jgi:hypothetical protein
VAVQHLQSDAAPYTSSLALPVYFAGSTLPLAKGTPPHYVNNVQMSSVDKTSQTLALHSCKSIRHESDVLSRCMAVWTWEFLCV